MKKKIKVFETFSGIGAQHKALDILKKNEQDFDFEIVGTSEWDIRTNISYDLIHGGNLSNAELERRKSNWNKNHSLSDYVHSNNTKTAIKKSLINEDSIGKNVYEKLEASYYENNNLGSIVNIHSDDIEERIGHFDLLTYSFPCQDLSSAGKFQNGNKGMKKNSGTRSGLLWEVERILNELDASKPDKKNMPKYLLLENVENMLSDMHIKDYSKWLISLRKLGYSTQTFLLNAKDFGIPQSRKRVYAVSILNDKSFVDTYEKNKNKSLPLREKILENSDLIPKVAKEYGIEKKMEDILKLNYSSKKIKDEAADCVLNDTTSRRKMTLKNPFLYIPKNNWNEKNMTKYRLENYHIGPNGDYFYNYTKTITTKQDRNPNGGLVQIPKTLQKYAYENNYGGFDKLNYRFLTPRETFLLMGFEDSDYDKLVKSNYGLSKEVLYREAGNSIVVNVLVSIFKYMFS